MVDPPIRVEGNQLQIGLPNLINAPGIPIRLAPILPSINRRYHFRLNAVKEILDPRVSKLYFEKVKDELKKNAESYRNILTIREIFYPNI